MHTSSNPNASRHVTTANTIHIAIVGAGVAGAACAHALAASGSRVTLFDKARGMPALCRALIGELDVRTGERVSALHRIRGVWPQRFDRVVLALPPAQLPGTDFDRRQPKHGPLANIVRNDRKPGRPSTPGQAVWVAQASAAWSAIHADDRPAAVSEALRDALRAELNPGGAIRWCHSTVHRWLYARPARTPLGTPGCWWDAAKGLGVCGDFLAGPRVEAAFLSGLDMAQAAVGTPTPRRTPASGAARFARML